MPYASLILVIKEAFFMPFRWRIQPIISIFAGVIYTYTYSYASI